MEKVLLKTPNDGESQDTNGGDEYADDASSTYEVENGSIFMIRAGRRALISNFVLLIVGQKLVRDEGRITERMLDLEFQQKDKVIGFRISSEEFLSNKLKTKLLEVAGPSAIIFGSFCDVRLAAQVLSGYEIPETILCSSLGFTEDGCFLSKRLLITPDKIITDPEVEVDLSDGNFSSNLGFSMPDYSIMPQLGEHILNDFMALKSDEVMYPLMGHIMLSPFSSVLKKVFGKGKPAMHLQGPSGGGKTFLGVLATNFFGTFDDRFVSWSSTANSIEAEGWYFRDALFLVDDYKSGITAPETFIRIFQNHADNHGRGRLNSSSKILKTKYVRGLLLSTGEDAVSDMESITGRTILITVEPEKNHKAGYRCWQNREIYSMFLPGIIQKVIYLGDWEHRLRQFVDKQTQFFASGALGLSNGLRIASNWALNQFGFELFVNFLLYLGVIDECKKKEMITRYVKIAVTSLQSQQREIQIEGSINTMFRIVGQKLSTGAVSITGLFNTAHEHGKIIGFAKDSDNSVCIYPDMLMEKLVAHFKAVGQRMPFTKNGLRDALAREGLIAKAENGRWTRQVRGDAGCRFNAWEFQMSQFKGLCGLKEEKS